MSQIGKYFSLTPPIETLTGNTGGPVMPSGGNINVVGDTITITVAGNPATHTLTISTVGTGVVSTLTGNSGGPVSPTAGNINVVGDGTTIDVIGTPLTSTLTITTVPGSIVSSITGDVGPAQSGALILTGGVSGAIFTGAAGTITESFHFLSLPATTAVNGQIKINGSTFLHNYNATNIFLGNGTGNFTLTGNGNIGIGQAVLPQLTTGNNNVFIGNNPGQIAFNTGSSNIAIGTTAMWVSVSASNNIAIGADSLVSLASGSENIAIGNNSGGTYTTAESNNIVIGNSGVIGESNVLRIGTTGSGSNQQDVCYIAGIDGVNVGAVATVVTEAADQLGTAVITAGTQITITPGPNTITIAAPNAGVSSITGDVGPAQSGALILTGGVSGAIFTGAAGTITESFNFLALPTSVSAVTGYISLGGIPFLHNFGSVSGPTNSNVFVGEFAGNFTLTAGTAIDNTGLGAGVLSALTTGTMNTSTGHSSSFNITSGSSNCSYGDSSLFNLLTGSNNIALGIASGSSYTTSESSNIVIGNIGTITESNVLRIGTNGSGPAQQNTCFIAGIDGVNVGSVATVVTESGNQLGTAVITAGIGITVTSGANTITIATDGTLTYTLVNTTPYVVLATDQYLGVDASGMAITVNLPNAPATGRVWIIKDKTGSASTNNITVTTVGGAVNIDGATTFVMNTTYESIQVIFNGVSYEVF